MQMSTFANPVDVWSREVFCRSGQRLDWCDLHQILHGMGELPIECDECVGLELGQGDVLGVIGVGPPELVGDLPSDC